MSTSSLVSAAWVANIFGNSVIQAISPKYYTYAVTQESELEIEKLSYNQEINFWQLLVYRGHQKLMTEVLQYDFSVEVGYFRTKANDTTGTAWAAVRDSIETLYDIVTEQLGEKWSDTVDFWTPQEGPAEIIEIELADESVWQGIYRFNAIQQISI